MNGTVPWGLTQAVPLPPPEADPHILVGLCPHTQQGVYVGPGGEPIQAGKHGTNRQTSGCLATGGGDGKDPRPADDTASTDYGQD